jgi:hypothetical protein
MTFDERRPESTGDTPELKPYLDELGGLRPPEPDPVPQPDATREPGDTPMPPIDTPDPRLDGPAERTGGIR